MIEKCTHNPLIATGDTKRTWYCNQFGSDVHEITTNSFFFIYGILNITNFKSKVLSTVIINISFIIIVLN